MSAIGHIHIDIGNMLNASYENDHAPNYYIYILGNILLTYQFHLIF